MLFTSHEFLFLFLPLAFGLFWYGGRSLRWRLGFLTFASYVFYSWWQWDTVNWTKWEDFTATLRLWEPGKFRAFLYQWRFTLVMLGSSSVDFFAAKWIARLTPEPRAAIDTPPAADERQLNYAPAQADDPHHAARAALLALSLIANLGLLSFFKYAGFFTHIADDIVRFFHGGGVPILAVILPVGISFYTFESMSYVIDVYRGLAKPARSYLDYACFISFFPHLVAGPIIRWSDILHQFRDVNWIRRGPDWEQVQRGLLLLTMGMAKKLLIADYIAREINPMWGLLKGGTHLGFTGGWAAVLGYTFQIYFDFSGYSDMAGGMGHLFAVRLPQNFDSPYKATDPSDFWRRWHITLSTWLRDYLFIPLGGSRGGTLKTIRNLFITMLLGGLWHGAAWLFVIWGAWHGILLAVWNLMRRFKLTVSTAHPIGLWANRQATFFLVVIGWVFFRAADVATKSYGWPSLSPAFDMMKSMAGGHGYHVRRAVNAVVSPNPSLALWGMILFAWVWCNFVPNSYQIVYRHRLRLGYAILAGAVMAACGAHLGMKIDFLYFRF